MEGSPFTEFLETLPSSMLGSKYYDSIWLLCPSEMKKLLLSFVFFLNACRLFGQYDAIFKLSHTDQVFSVDSLFILFLSLDSNAEAQEIKKLYKAAEKSDPDFGTLNLKREELAYALKRNPKLVLDEREAEELLKKMEQGKYVILQAHMNLNLGYYYCYLQKPKLALGFQHLLRANELFKQLPYDRRTQSQQYLLYSIASEYYKFKDIDNALKLSLESFNTKAAANETFVFAADLIGACYLMRSQADSAAYYFHYVLEHVNQSPLPKAWTGIAKGNLGSVYFLQHEYDKATPLLIEGMKGTMEENVYNNSAGFAADLSTIWLSENNFEEAKKYLDESLYAAHLANDLAKFYKVYKAAANYHRALGHNHEALIFTDSATIMKDSLDLIYNAMVKSKGEMAFMSERQHTYAKEKQKELILRNFIIGFIFMAMIIVLLLFNRQRLKMRSRKQQFEAEKQMTEQELNLAMVQLNDFTNSIIEKNKLIDIASLEFEKVKLELNQLQNSKPDNSLSAQETTDSLHILRESVILTNNDWNNFTSLFEKVHPQFFINLKGSYPELSPAEIRFVTLSKLKLSNKEMAYMLGISTDAIRQIRSRLRKKISLDTDTGFEDLVETV